MMIFRVVVVTFVVHLMYVLLIEGDYEEVSGKIWARDKRSGGVRTVWSVPLPTWVSVNGGGGGFLFLCKQHA